MPSWNRVAIRPAEDRDAYRLAGLRWAFRSAVSAPVEGHVVFRDRCARWMKDALSPGGRWQAWLAEEKGEIVGNVWLNCIDKIPNPGAEPEVHAYLSNLYVLPDARGRGLGRDLLRAALAHCQRLHPHAVLLWPSERSRTLYERAGFQPALDVMTCNLESSEET
jgi:GNAT superfamily N-acetyltransferase